MGESKKIFIVVGSFKLGGTERTASRIGIELIERGYDVKFILLKTIFDYDDQILKNNSISLQTEKYKSNLVKIIRSYIDILRLIRIYKPNYLFSTSIAINIFLFFTFHKSIFFRIETNIFIFKKKLYRRYLQKYMSAFGNVKQVVVPSKELEKACSIYFNTDKKLVTINNPLDVENINISSKEEINIIGLDNSRYIISAGRLHPMKGFEQLVEVYANSNLVSKGIHLIIMGEGPMRKILESQIARLKLDNKVHLIGFQNNPYKFIANSEFLVLNSNFESFGNVIIEAFACGVPVVANDCDFGPRELIQNNINGYLYKKEDELNFKETLEMPLNDMNHYQTLKKGALESAKKFEVSGIVNNWINLLK